MSECVLFVDDEQNVFDSIQRAFRKQFEFRTAQGLSEGLRVFQSGPFALVVSDMRMPEMSGAQFLAKRTVREVRLKDLAVGMILDHDLVSPQGFRLVPSGDEVTRTLIVRLTSIADGVGVAEPFRVRVSTS